MIDDYRPLVCGTKKTKRLGPDNYRVVCATCEGGGTVKYKTHDEAAQRAIARSPETCTICGAS